MSIKKTENSMITEENVMANENMITGNTEENKNNRGDDLKKTDPGEKPSC